MKKLDLNMAAEEFEIIDSEMRLFYNKETGEFDFYSDYIDPEEDDSEKFEEDCWIAAPEQYDLHDYDMMVEFAETLRDPRAHKALSSILGGRGAFRHFKATVERLGYMEEWYAFRHNAYCRVAEEWCKENGIPYEALPELKEKPRGAKDSVDFSIFPLVKQAVEAATELLCECLGYTKHNAEFEVHRMLKRPNIAYGAMADGGLIGLVGAMPQYGSTGWELHPLAVSAEYRGNRVGSQLLEAAEHEAASRGAVMMYLGCDDEMGTTSLYGKDLYDDLFGKIADIKNLGGHPFSFYKTHGYEIVGVLPDANGIGKPDILMAKSILSE